MNELESGIQKEAISFFPCYLSTTIKTLTGSPKLGSGLEQLLQGNTRNEWNIIKSTIQPNSLTIVIFNERITLFKKLYIPEPSAVDNQHNYLQQIYKNDKYMELQFLHRLKHVKMLIDLFPDITIYD